MKKITFLLLTLLYSLLGFSQEDFEGASFPPAGWITASGPTNVGTTVWASSAQNPCAGTKMAFIASRNTGMNTLAEDWLITNQQTITTANMQLRFLARQATTGDQGTKYQIRTTTSANQSDLSSYTTLRTFTEAEMNASATVCESKSVDNIPTGTTYIAFVRVFTMTTAGQFGDRWFIDNVEVVEKCPDVTGLTVDTNFIFATSASKLQWTPATPTPGSGYQIQVYKQGDVPGTPIDIPTPNIVAGKVEYNTSPDYTLDPETTYQYRVRSKCSSSIFGEWSSPFNFITLKIGAICADPIKITALGYQSSSNTALYGDHYDPTGAQGASCGATPATTNYFAGNDVFYSYTADTTGPVSFTLNPTATNSALFVYGGCPGATTPGACLGGVANTNSSPRTFTLTLTAGSTYVVVVSSAAATQTVGYTLIIQKEDCTPKPLVTTFGATPLSTTSATLTWGAVTGITEYEIAVQALNAGIPTTNGHLITGGATTYTATDITDGLQAGTKYEFYVRTKCGTSSYSGWAGPFIFNTLICDTANKCDYTFNLTNTANGGWHNGKMEVRQNGIVVGTLGLTTGTTGTQTVSLCKDIPFDLYWSVAGTAPTQIGVSITNSFSQVIYTKAPNTGAALTVLYSTPSTNCTTPDCTIPPTNVHLVTGPPATITTTSFQVAWTSPSLISWDVYVAQTGSPAPTQATPATYAGVTNNTNFLVDQTSLPVAGPLLPDHSYDVYVRSACSPEGSIWVKINASVTTLPTCFKPTVPAIIATSTTQTSAEFTFTKGLATDTQWEVYLAQGPDLPATPPDNTTPPSTFPTVYTAVSATSEKVAVSGLSAATIYYFYVRTYCSATDQSTWTGPIKFNTVTCDETAKCNYKFVLTDIGGTGGTGNGWNGAKMQVRQNGIIVKELTMTSGGNTTVSVGICPNIPFDLFWSVEGTAPDEVGVSVQNPFLDVLYTKAPGTGAVSTVLYASIGNCTPAPCSKPTGMTASSDSTIVGATVTTTVTFNWTDNSTPLPPGSDSFDLYIFPTGSGSAPINDPASAPTIANIPNGYSSTTYDGINPFIPSKSYTYYVRANCGGGTHSTWTVLTPTVFITEPVNDECVRATPITINAGQECVAANTAVGNTYGATASLPAGGTATGCGTTDDDVWYSFVAGATSQTITISDIVPSPATATTLKLNHSVFSGTCGALTQVYCSTTNTSIATGLVPGQTYYIRVYTLANTAGQSATFKICITSPPVNDECANAKSVTVNTGQTCAAVNTVSSNTYGATGSLPAGTTAAGCGNTDDDVWFKFVAGAVSQTINLSNIVTNPAASTTIKLNFSVFSGDCTSLTQLSCYTTNSGDVTGLTIGQTYYVRVYTAGNTLGQSASFDICITSPPANDECINAQTVTVNSGQYCQTVNTVSGNTLGATASSPVLNPVLTGAGCGPTNSDIWYKFVALNTSQIINISNVVPSPASTTFKLNYSVFSGTCNALTKINCYNTDYTAFVQGLTVGSTYYIRIYPATTTAGQSATFDLCITSPPVNDECAHAIPVTVNTGQDCLLANVVTGNTLGAVPSIPGTLPTMTGATCGATRNDIWYSFVAANTSQTINLSNIVKSPTTATFNLNYSVFSGTCSSLTNVGCFDTTSATILNLTPGQTYYVRIYTNNASLIQSATFDLCITSPPVNDECVNAITAPVNSTSVCDQVIFGNTLGATPSSPITTPVLTNTGGCGLANNDMWYKFVATNDVHLINLSIISGTPTTATLNHSLFSGNCGALTKVYCTAGLSSVATGLVPGQTYYIRVYAATNALGQSMVFRLCIKTPPPPPVPNDNCVNAISVQVNDGGQCQNISHGTIYGATASGGTNGCIGNANDDVWFSFVATKPEHFVSLINVEGTTSNLNFAVYTGSCGSLTISQCSAANELSIYDTNYVPGQTYYVRVWSNSAASQIVLFDICVKSVSKCENAAPLCAGDALTPLIFPNTTGVDSTGQIACLGQNPDPTYYYLSVAETGPLEFQIRQSTDINNFPLTGAPGLDVDYVCWGPFTSEQACSEIVFDDCPSCPNNTTNPNFYPFGNIVDCSYDAAPVETLHIPNAIAGQYYLLLVTNFSDDPGYIKLFQSNSTPGTGNGSTTNYCCKVDLGPDKVVCSPTTTLNALQGVVDPLAVPDSYLWYKDGSSTPIPNQTGSTLEVNQGGIYKVVGNCGINSVPDDILITFLPPIGATVPAEYIKCDINSPSDILADGKSNFDLNTLTPQVFGTLNQADFNISYHTSTADANANPALGAIPLNVDFVNTIPFQQIIYVRVERKSDPTCFQIVEALLTVTKVKNADFEYDALEYCKTASATDPVLSYIGIGEAGTFSYTATPSTAILSLNTVTGAISISGSDAGEYVVTNTVPGGVGCASVPFNVNIKIKDPSKTAFTYDSNVYCKTATANPVLAPGIGSVMGTFSYTATPATAVLDLNTTTGAITLSGSDEGVYVITNTVLGCSDAPSTFQITITSVVSTDFHYDSLDYCQTSAANPVLSYTNGGVQGTFSYTATPSGAVLNLDTTTGAITLAGSDAGDYVVTNTVSVTGGCPSTPTSVNVKITAPDSGSFSYDNIIYCIGAANPVLTIGPGSISGTFSYISPTGGTLAIDPAGNISLAGSTTGDYTIINTLPSAVCNPLPATFNITITTTQTADFSYDKTDYCTSGGNAVFTLTPGSSMGALSYTAVPATAVLSWNAATGLIDLASSSEGTYEITNLVAASGGCSQIEKKVTITITKDYKADFSYPNATYCKAAGTASPSFIPTSKAGTFNAIPSGLSINPQTGVIDLGASAEGNYQVRNKIDDTLGCGTGDTKFFTISIVAPLTGTISYNTPFCIASATAQNGTVNNTVTTLPAGSTGMYSSSPAGLAINAVTGEITPSGSLEGTYTVSYSVSPSSVCNDLPFTTQVTIIPESPIMFTNGCDLSSYKIEATGNFDIATSQFLWTGPGVVAIPGHDNAINVNKPGLYTLTIITASGCTEYKDITLTANDLTCVIQKGISPGDADKNNNFDLTAFNVRKLEIFNRYGTEVYSFGAYTNQWHGQSSSGKELPDGTYFYVISKGDGTTATGWVYINRKQ